MLPLLFNLILFIMPKNSVLSRPQVSAAPGRHDFDRSFVSNFNQSAGMILPVFCEQVIAGTKGVINARRFTRTKNVIFPAFQQVTQHTDFYKVPLRLLWSYWNDWKLNINDLNGATLLSQEITITSGSPEPQNLPTSVPRINLNKTNLLAHYNSSSSYGTTDDNIQRCNDALRLFDMLGYGRVMKLTSNYEQSLFKLAAYQKVYYDHFRNTTYETNNPFAYNLDWLSKQSTNGLLDYTTGVSAAAQWNAFEYLTQLHYVNYRNDYFHNIYPSLNYSVSTPTGSDWQIPSDLTSVQYGGLSSNSQLVGAPVLSAIGNAPLVHSSNTSYGAVSVQSLRAAFALDKLLRASAYAPKHVYSQIEARFGVKVNKKVVSDESEHLGSFMNDIVFGEVTSTANTAQVGDPSNLGEIGGKGVGASDFGEDINFYAEEDSLIIGVQYFLPRATYDADGSKAWNIKLTKNDFFQPEFEHLGLRPLYLKEISLATLYPNNAAGYKEPNQEYKVGIDENHGLFKEVFDFVEEDPNISGSIIAGDTNSQLSAFVVHTSSNYLLRTAASSDYFKCRPSDLDYIFEQDYDGTQLTDQFYGNIRFKFAVNAPMSVHGNPML